MQSISGSFLRIFLMGLAALTLASCFDGDGDTVAVEETQVWNAAFEQLAVLEQAGIGGASISDKTVRVETVLDAIRVALDAVPEIDTAYGMHTAGTLGSSRALVNFPAVDYNMDRVPDEVGRLLEVNMADDADLLAADMRFGLLLPWQIAAYTEEAEDRIQVVAGVPETLVRAYFRDNSDIDALLAHAVNNRELLEDAVAGALEPLGFTILKQPLAGGTVLGEPEIAALEARFGPLTPDFSVPTITLSGGFVDAPTVVSAIENLFLADQVPDLDTDGVAGTGGDDAVLPNAMTNFLMGAMSFEEFSGMLAQGEMVWSQGGAFQDWDLLRTFQLAGPDGAPLYVLELCQHFYGGMVLSFGLHHMPAMPCMIGVWEDAGEVHVSILNTGFILGYLFSDVQLDPAQPMAQVFAVFPSFVFNELAGGVNAALRGLGVAEQFEFFPLM